MNNSQPDAPLSPSRSTRLMLIGLAVAVVVMAGLYFLGLHQGRGELAAQKADHEQRMGALQADLQQQQSNLAAAENQIQFLRARAAFYRTAVDLDQRNFGTANTHLQQAATFLEHIKGDAGGVKSDGLAALRAAVVATNINVATDLQAQRDKVLGFGRELDSMAPAQWSTDAR